MSIQRILVPVDFSLRSREALRHAIELARATGAEIAVMHVVAAPGALEVVADAYLGIPVPNSSTVAAMWAEEQLDALVASVDCSGVMVHKRVEVGDPAATIVRIATDETDDLIVLGTHGRTGLANVVLGSVARELLTASPCPLLTFRAFAT